MLVNVFTHLHMLHMSNEWILNLHSNPGVLRTLPSRRFRPGVLQVLWFLAPQSFDFDPQSCALKTDWSQFSEAVLPAVATSRNWNGFRMNKEWRGHSGCLILKIKISPKVWENRVEWFLKVSIWMDLDQPFLPWCIFNSSYLSNIPPFFIEPMSPGVLSSTLETSHITPFKGTVWVDDFLPPRGTVGAFPWVTSPQVAPKDLLRLKNSDVAWLSKVPKMSAFLGRLYVYIYIQYIYMETMYIYIYRGMIYCVYIYTYVCYIS